MKLRLTAPAKLNLVLEVLGRRPDGFHELASVVHCIDLADSLEAEEAEGVRLGVAGRAGPVRENLVLRAARDLREAGRLRRGASLQLVKRIPAGAGLGGGSSDGAAALRLLARLWGVRAGAVDLAAIAAGLGSDVPLFLRGPAALIEGRGERVRRVAPLPSGVFVVVVPRWEVERKTARAFGALEPGDFSSGERARRLAVVLDAGRDVGQGLFFNGLARASERTFGELAGLRRDLEDATGLPFALSGAGPALFHLAGDRVSARACAERARRFAASVFTARPRRGMPKIRTASTRSFRSQRGI